MADLTITAASVLAGSNATTRQGTAGATITAGQVVYFDDTTKTYKLAKSTSVLAIKIVEAGVAI